ncbi:hypothetical protein KGD82_13765 [Nocardiopsis eucommiae]|uniref:Uncharacterized protein n=1 Tax=Nocardiopsis eucommiae TaxID=2831970 RepID=A0A975QM57_9ACTN|nr:hypothetical protein KGD82_13765 [Nocardiopsis eucommiae]
MNEPNETLEFAGPVNDGWYRTQIPDWIALNPELKDGSFRLYCILRALILEKQKNRIRVLSHEQIAFLAVGKNGKPASISTIKALLANLQEVGLIANPDGSRIVTSSGPGSIQSRRRYQFSDWPTSSSSYTGWRNAFDKLDAYTDDWRDSRTDVSRGRFDSQKTDPRDDQQGNTPGAGHLEGQKSDGHGQKSDLDSQKSGENPSLTSEDVPSLKEIPEGVTSTSSSSVEVEDITNVVAPEQTKKKTESPEAIIERRLGCTPDEAAKVATLINQQGDGRGGRIRSLSWWVENRDIHTLRQDLAIVRGHQGPAGASKPLDEGERIRRMQKGGYQPYKNPVDQDVYDEPLLPVPEKAHTGARAPVPDNEYWDTITDEQYAQQWRSS